MLNRGRRSIGIDLKNPDGVEALLKLVESADAIIEGFRPGVMERLGVGPDVCLARNPKLVFGRMTGWGQDGPYAPLVRPRHQLHRAGRRAAPTSVAGARARRRRSTWWATSAAGACSWPSASCAPCSRPSSSGQGQVIDAAMVDGSAVLMTMFHAFRAMGMFDEDHRGTNLLDTGAPFYDVYRCADGKYISVGSIEPQFYAELLRSHRAAGRSGVRQPDGQGAAGRCSRAGSRCVFRPEDPRRVVRDHGAHRRLLRARC